MDDAATDTMAANLATGQQWRWQLREDLIAEVHKLVETYWQHHYKHNGALPPWEKSRLSLRAVEGSGREVSIQWQWTKWYKGKDGRYHPLSQYIRKGKAPGYPLSVLRKHAKDWEVDLVVELETRFAQIRQYLRELKRIEDAMGRMGEVAHAEARLGDAGGEGDTASDGGGSDA